MYRNINLVKTLLYLNTRLVYIFPLYIMAVAERACTEDGAELLVRKKVQFEKAARVVNALATQE